MRVREFCSHQSKRNGFYIRYEMTGSPRKREVPEVPYDALCEALINAVAHRDYFKKVTDLMVEMFYDRIEITSYGGLVKGLKREDFGKKSVLRNPNIANLLMRAGYIEKIGTGINKIKRLVAKAGLPAVEFGFSTFFTVIFKRKKAEAITEIFGAKFSENFNVKGKQLDRMVSIIIRAAHNRDLKVPELADEFDVSIRTLYEGHEETPEMGCYQV